jgi:lambda family phage portal protein
MLGKLLDKGIAIISPGWAFKRLQARTALAAYNGADISRVNRDWKRNQYSADGALLPDKSILNARAREATRNHWAGSSIVRGFVRHVIGSGILSKSNARDANGEPLSDFNEHIDWAFNYWGSRPELCDIERRRTLVGMQRLIARELKTVGQAIIIKRLVYGKSNPLRFQVIEPEQLDQNLTKNPETGYEIHGGVECDEYSGAVAYWVHTKEHPLDTNSKSTRIPAEDVLHLIDPERVRQTQGCTEFAPVLDKMRALQMYDSYTLIRAKYEAAIGMVIENASTGTNPLIPSTAPVTTNSSGSYEVTIEPGMSPSLLPGQTAKFHNPTTPGGQYEPFTYQQINEISAGAGSDYATTVRDFSKGSFSAQRQAKLEHDLETDPIQRLIIDLVLRPMRELFIELEILLNNVAAPDFNKSLRDRSRYLGCIWKPPAKPWIDPANQAAAAKIELDYRLNNRSNIILETKGEYFTDVMDQLDDEYEYAENLGIIFPEVAAAPVRNPNEPIPGNQSPSAPGQKTNGNPNPQPQFDDDGNEIPADPNISTNEGATDFETLKMTMDTYGIGVRAGTITPQTPDEEFFRGELGLPSLSSDASAAWSKDKGVRRPITITPPPGQAVPSFPAKSPDSE